MVVRNDITRARAKGFPTTPEELAAYAARRGQPITPAAPAAPVAPVTPTVPTTPVASNFTPDIVRKRLKDTASRLNVSGDDFKDASIRDNLFKSTFNADELTRLKFTPEEQAGINKRDIAAQEASAGILNPRAEPTSGKLRILEQAVRAVADPAREPGALGTISERLGLSGYESLMFDSRMRQREMGLRYDAFSNELDNVADFMKDDWRIAANHYKVTLEATRADAIRYEQRFRDAAAQERGMELLQEQSRIWKDQQNYLKELEELYPDKPKEITPSEILAGKKEGLEYDKNLRTFYKPVAGFASPDQAPEGGFRTDRHNNPTAMTAAVAQSLGLQEGVDYTTENADSLNSQFGPGLVSAQFLGEPYQATIKGLDLAANAPDRRAFFTLGGKPRWDYLPSAPTDEEWLAKTSDEKKDFITAMYRDHEQGTGVLVPGSQVKGEGEGGLFKLDEAQQEKVDKLSDDLRVEPKYKDMVDIRSGYLAVITGFKFQNGPGDLAMINGFQKMVDPGVSVRQEEFKTVAAAQGWLQRILNTKERVIEGDTMNGPARKKFFEVANELYEEKANDYNKTTGTIYRKRAASTPKIPFELISEDFPDTAGQLASSYDVDNLIQRLEPGEELVVRDGEPFAIFPEEFNQNTDIKLYP